MKHSISTSQMFLQIFIAIGAIPAGILLVAESDGSAIGFPEATLHQLQNNSIFDNFLIPGIVLLAFIGLGNCLGAYLTYHKHPLSGITAIMLGGGLCIWITVQIMVIDFSWLFHPLYFILGIIEASFGFMLYQRNEFSLKRKISSMT